MKQEEIEKAAEDYAERKRLQFDDCSFKDALKRDFKAGADFANKYWQEKTRWKSLTTESPTEFGENKQILIKHRNSEISMYLLYSNRSAEHAVDMGFIEWKEVD